MSPTPEQLGYTRIPTVSSARALYGRIEPVRGNLVLLLESTGQLAALRQTRPPGFVTPSQARSVGMPGGGTAFRRETREGLSMPSATLPEQPSIREQRMRLARGAPYSAPGVLELPLNAPPRPVQATGAEREEYSTLLIPAEVLDALRDYYGRRGVARVTQAEAVNAAAYAIFTAKLRALPMGRTVTVGSPRWVLEQLAAAELPGRGVRGEAFAPGRFPETWTPPNLPSEVPVSYSTIVAVLFFTHGDLYLRRENLSNLLRDQLGWHPCGTSGVFATPRTGMYLPATNETIWCPPPRSFPIAPPAEPQRRFESGPPVFSQHARPRSTPPAPPPRYRRFS